MCARGSRTRARSSRSRSKSSQRADVTRESTTLEHIRVNVRKKHAEHQNLQLHRNTLCAFVATPTASQNDSIHTVHCSLRVRVETLAVCIREPDLSSPFFPIPKTHKNTSRETKSALFRALSHTLSSCRVLLERRRSHNTQGFD